MRIVLSLVFASALGACSGSHRDDEPDASVTARGDGPGDLHRSRCVLRDPVYANARATVTSPWVERGADRARLFARVQDQDLVWANTNEGGFSLPTSVGPEHGAFAWTGSRYVTLSWREPTRDYVDSAAPARVDYKVEVRDGQFQSARPSRARLPGSTCSAQVTALAGRALLTWRQRQGRTCEEGGGVGWFQVLDANGEPLSAPHPLTVGLEGREEHVRLDSLSARWDFGRVVITAQRSGMQGPASWVLGPDGERLWYGDAERVVCARSGCFRVRDNHENSTYDQDNIAIIIRFERLGGSGFNVSAVMRGIRAAHVSGDRVLFLHTPPQNVTGCGLTIIDVGRRSVVLDEHENTMTCDESSATALPRGFMVAGLDPSRGVATRVIDCAW